MILKIKSNNTTSVIDTRNVSALEAYEDEYMNRLDIYMDGTIMCIYFNEDKESMQKNYKALLEEIRAKENNEN